jgi:hypothetical protein
LSIITDSQSERMNQRESRTFLEMNHKVNCITKCNYACDYIVALLSIICARTVLMIIIIMHLMDCVFIFVIRLIVMYLFKFPLGQAMMVGTAATAASE